eukprot:917209-Pleurochrysis_carterae.AAC.1
MTPRPLEYGNDFDFDMTTFIMNPPPPLAKGRVRGCGFGTGSFPGVDMALLECCAVCGSYGATLRHASSCGALWREKRGAATAVLH